MQLTLQLTLFAITFLQQPLPERSPLVSPAGPYPVGRMLLHWTDSKRPELIGSGHRELLACVWYPSVAVKSEYAPYMPSVDFLGDDSAAAAFANLFGAAWPKIRSNVLRSHAFANAPLTANKGLLPILVFSPGGGGTPIAYTTQMEELASNGYVVVGVEHTFDSPAVIFPDGRVNRYASEFWSLIRSESSSEEAYEKRIAAILADDIPSTIDRLRDINTDRASIFHSRLDMSRIGAFGHSRGGRIAARACQIDARIKACLNEDGNWSWQPYWLDERGQSLQQPFMMLDHLDPELPDDVFAQIGTTRETYVEERGKSQAEAREKLYETVAGGAYHFTIVTPGISHNSFSDIRLLGRPDGAQINLWPKDVQSATPHAHILRLISELTRSFFDACLRGKNASQLLSIAKDEVRVERYGRAAR